MSTKTKLSQLQAYMASGDWSAAVKMAAKFPRLGEHRGAILDAHLALTNPRWVIGLRQDPAALIEAGKAAIIAAYSR